MNGCTGNNNYYHCHHYNVITMVYHGNNSNMVIIVIAVDNEFTVTNSASIEREGDHHGRQWIIVNQRMENYYRDTTSDRNALFGLTANRQSSEYNAAHNCDIGADNMRVTFRCRCRRRCRGNNNETTRFVWRCIHMLLSSSSISTFTRTRIFPINTVVVSNNHNNDHNTVTTIVATSVRRDSDDRNTRRAITGRGSRERGRERRVERSNDDTRGNDDAHDDGNKEEKNEISCTFTLFPLLFWINGNTITFIGSTDDRGGDGAFVTIMTSSNSTSRYRSPHCYSRYYLYGRVHRCRCHRRSVFMLGSRSNRDGGVRFVILITNDRLFLVSQDTMTVTTTPILMVHGRDCRGQWRDYFLYYISTICTDCLGVQIIVTAIGRGWRWLLRCQRFLIFVLIVILLLLILVDSAMWMSHVSTVVINTVVPYRVIVPSLFEVVLLCTHCYFSTINNRLDRQRQFFNEFIVPGQRVSTVNGEKIKKLFISLYRYRYVIPMICVALIVVIFERFDHYLLRNLPYPLEQVHWYFVLRLLLQWWWFAHTERSNIGDNGTVIHDDSIRYMKIFNDANDDDDDDDMDTRTIDILMLLLISCVEFISDTNSNNNDEIGANDNDNGTNEPSELLEWIRHMFYRQMEHRYSVYCWNKVWLSHMIVLWLTYKAYYSTKSYAGHGDDEDDNGFIGERRNVTRVNSFDNEDQYDTVFFEYYADDDASSIVSSMTYSDIDIVNIGEFISAFDMTMDIDSNSDISVTYDSAEYDFISSWSLSMENVSSLLEYFDIDENIVSSLNRIVHRNILLEKFDDLDMNGEQQLLQCGVDDNVDRFYHHIRNNSDDHCVLLSEHCDNTNGQCNFPTNFQQFADDTDDNSSTIDYFSTIIESDSTWDSLYFDTPSSYADSELSLEQEEENDTISSNSSNSDSTSSNLSNVSLMCCESFVVDLDHGEVQQWEHYFNSVVPQCRRNYYFQLYSSSVSSSELTSDNTINTSTAATCTTSSSSTNITGVSSIMDLDIDDESSAIWSMNNESEYGYDNDDDILYYENDTLAMLGHHNIADNNDSMNEDSIGINHDDDDDDDDYDAALGSELCNRTTLMDDSNNNYMNNRTTTTAGSTATTRELPIIPNRIIRDIRRGGTTANISTMNDNDNSDRVSSFSVITASTASPLQTEDDEYIVTTFSQDDRLAFLMDEQVSQSITGSSVISDIQVEANVGNVQEDNEKRRLSLSSHFLSSSSSTDSVVDYSVVWSNEEGIDDTQEILIESNDDTVNSSLSSLFSVTSYEWCPLIQSDNDRSSLSRLRRYSI